MTTSQINNMNIVTNTSAINCVIVITKDIKVVTFANCNLGNIWH